MRENFCTRLLGILARIDILFLIDGGKPASSILDILASLLDNLETNEDQTLRVGVSLYGDFRNRRRTRINHPLRFRTPLSLGSTKRHGSLARLAKQRPYRRRTGVPFQAVFAAILRSIRGSDWKAPRQRYLIHIGDLADRRAELPPRLLDALFKNRITYLPIALMPPSDETDGHGFLDQAGAILSRYWPAVVSTYQFSKVGMLDNPGKHGALALDDTSATLRRLLQRILSNGSEITTRIRADAVRKRIDRLAPIAARLVTNPRTASESSDRSPLSGFRGRVASHGRSTGGTYWERLALLEESELPILAGVMETLCHASRDRAAAIGTEQRVSQLLGAVSGDRIEGTKTPYGYLEQVLGIPFPERTLLRRPLTEIEEYLVRLTDSAERESLRKGLCRASTLLGLIRRGQRPDPDKGMRWTGTGWDVEKPQPFDWTLRLKDEPGLIPIPLDYFP